MSASPTPTPGQPMTLEQLVARLAELEARVKALEETIQHDHEVLEHDHEVIEKLEHEGPSKRFTVGL